MADIPEVGVPGVADRMDPRTGLVSPQAVSPSTDSVYSNTLNHQSESVGPSTSRALPSFEDRMALDHPATRTRTEDFELKNMPRYPGT